MGSLLDDTIRKWLDYKVNCKKTLTPTNVNRSGENPTVYIWCSSKTCMYFYNQRCNVNLYMLTQGLFNRSKKA